MRVLVAMSGGVDSAVAAARIRDAGHEVVGATMKLWGGSGDSGCCSVADVTDARRVADRLGVDHRVFNFTAEFDRAVVEPYVEDHRVGRTPNPCVACNTELKFGAFLERALRLGFDAVATGHHARTAPEQDGSVSLRRGADAAKDQSYVLATLGQRALGRLLLPVGEMTKVEVRAEARRLRLGVSEKPDSQDVCFIASRTPGLGRRAFLGERIELHRAAIVDEEGSPLGEVDGVELVTIGQRRGLGADTTGERRYAIEVDVAGQRIVVGPPERLLTGSVDLTDRTWTARPLDEGVAVEIQSSAHGTAVAGQLTGTGVRFDAPARRVAPGQLVACYRGDTVVGSGVAA